MHRAGEAPADDAARRATLPLKSNGLFMILFLSLLRLIAGDFQNIHSAFRVSCFRTARVLVRTGCCCAEQNQR